MTTRLTTTSTRLTRMIVSPAGCRATTRPGRGASWRRQGPDQPVARLPRVGSVESGPCTRSLHLVASRHDDAELFDAEPQRVGMEPQSHRRIAGAIDAPAALTQYLLDVLPLHGVERLVSRGGGRGPQRVVEPQRLAAGTDERTLDDVLQLADVARPVVTDQGIHNIVRHGGDVPREVLLVQLDERPDEFGDITPPGAQRRQRNLKDVE